MNHGILITDTFRIETGNEYFPGNSVKVFINGEIMENIETPYTGFLKKQPDYERIDELIVKLREQYPGLIVQDNLRKIGEFWDSIRDSKRRHAAFVEKNGYVYRTDLPRKSR